MDLFDPKATKLPSRSELPRIPGAPPGASWFWGKDDELGRLNLLTPDRTAAASKLIDTGEVVSLNWPIHLPDPPMFGRAPFKHKIHPITEYGNDDIFEINSQSSSQWDGLRHVSTKHGGKRIYYNNTTQEDIDTTARIGLQAWSRRGIVGRGVLIDYFEFKNQSYDPHSRHAITANGILECAAQQKIEFQYGDILILRTGFIHKYNQLGHEQRKRVAESSFATEVGFAGVEQSEEMLDFLHNHYFSIVVADSPGFECLPPTSDIFLHMHIIPLWGMGIGELFDLEALSQMCKKHGRWEFFFSSSPPNISGCYPNALAVF
ncbi:uncharacterized protein PV07_00660 [Cladophialophora immunda]|uniref:Cyclase n=1 Tax=Cladophialophora immunda TaxID=569365 RepID=A0A0D2A074_9EURO|nr:uncharacterized protein PV07_00660 [Cladophialophora immunda]KIW33841.1 hypothetical protein PV07_00660 [Cladophialophora immunda]